MKFKLGILMKDPVTGVQGIAISYSEVLSGTVQYGIRFPKKDGEEKYPDAVYLDEHLLEEAGPGISHLALPPQTGIPVNLGDEARDTITGIRGVVIERVDFLNNCVFFTIQPKAKFWQRQKPEELFVDFKRLRVLKHAKTVAAPMTHTAVPQRTGGPERAFHSPRG